MKKFLSLIIVCMCIITFVGCGNNTKPEPSKEKLSAPNIEYQNKTVSWQAVENAKGYLISKNGEELPMQTLNSYVFANTDIGTHQIKVKAISNDESKYFDSDWSNEIACTVELDDIRVYVVGDSTTCSFSDKYFYPRYGYATQLNDYLSEHATIINLAMSGRSSLSYLSEDYYELLKNDMREGDYLIIAFGHNDENSGDATKYTKPTLDVKDVEKTDGVYNFQYILNKYYIKLAKEKGATPILCTPIVRLDSSNDYTGSSGHVTSDGDYADCIVNLGEQTQTTVINLRDITKQEYITLGYDNAKYFHAVISGLSQTEANWNSIDKTHINVYGAKYIAYKLAIALRRTSLGLYVKSEITGPSKDVDLVVNPNYVYTDYEPVDWENYTAATNFTTMTDGWYGTAFGDLGGNPISTSNGYRATEDSVGVFEVGGTNSGKGKFANTSDGFAFVFKQINIDDNFVITATAEIVTTAGIKQAGFGLMLRDDCYTPVNNSAVMGYYVAAGILTNESDQIAIFARQSETSIEKSDNVISELYLANQTAILTIEKIDNVVKCTVEYGGETYEEEFINYSFNSKDPGNMYVGMFATRGTVVEFTNVEYTKK